MSKINEEIAMLETLKENSCTVAEVSTNKKHTIIKDISRDSFVINKAIKMLEEFNNENTNQNTV